MRQERRRSKGDTDNNGNAQVLTATRFNTGHSAQAIEQAAAIAAVRRRQHWSEQASALATAKSP